MIEPPQAPGDPLIPADNASQGAPPGASPPNPMGDDGGVMALADMEAIRQEIKNGIVSAAHALAVAEQGEEVQRCGQGLLAASQALVAVSPAMNPKVFEAMFVPKPEPTDQTAGKTGRPPRKAP